MEIYLPFYRFRENLISRTAEIKEFRENKFSQMGNFNEFENEFFSMNVLNPS